VRHGYLGRQADRQTGRQADRQTGMRRVWREVVSGSRDEG
jgi:hypothetical protein